MRTLPPPIAEIKPLTGLRGLAAFWVMAYHLHALEALPGPFGQVLRHGYLAVDLFFVLSGYIMTLCYAEWFTGHLPQAYGRFLLRRLARIGPLYLSLNLAIAISIWMGVSHALPREGLLSVLLLNNLFVQAWSLAPSLNIPAWSISTEWAAYLLFPAMLLLAPRSARGMSLCGLALVALLATMTFLPKPAWISIRHGPLDLSWDYTIWPLLRCLLEFSLGILTCRLAHLGCFRWLTPTRLLALAVLVAALLCLPNTDIALLLCAPLLIAGLAVGDGPLHRLFASRPLFFLGEISYALYLLHSQLLRIRHLGAPWLTGHIGPIWADAVLCLSYYAACLLLAWLTHRFFEQPARRWVRRAEERAFTRGFARAE